MLSRTSTRLWRPPTPASAHADSADLVDRALTIVDFRFHPWSLPGPGSLRRLGSGSARQLLRFRSSYNEVHLRCGWLVQNSGRLSGGVSRYTSVTGPSGRVSSNSVGQTFTAVVDGFIGAHLNSAVTTERFNHGFQYLPGSAVNFRLPQIRISE